MLPWGSLIPLQDIMRLPGRILDELCQPGASRALALAAILLTGLLDAAPATYDVRAYGARGDGKSNESRFIQAAIDACHKAGGGTVLLPPGHYLSGTIELKSNVTLHLENGAGIYASRNRDDYRPSSAHGANRGHLLIADGAENIAVTGKGLLHGQAEADYGNRWGVREDDRFRTGLILFTRCRNVTLRDFTILYSDFWTLHLKRCDVVTIDSVKIRNNPRRLNSDGIDLTSCRNVHITNCDVVAGDDAIDPKSQEGYPCENIVVANCTLETTTTGIKIGTATDGDFRNLHFSNITIKAPSGIGFYMKDGGIAENITFSNITIETPPRSYRDVVPVFMDIERRHADSRLSRIRDVSLRDIYIRSGSGILIQGMPESWIENLSIRNLNFRVPAADTYEKRVKPVGGGRSTKDERDTKYAQMPAYMAIAYVDGLRVDGVRLIQSPEALAKYQRSAVVIHEARNVTFRGLEATPPSGGQLPVIRLHNVEGATISDPVALPGTATFLEVTGETSKDIEIFGGRLSRAATIRSDKRKQD